MHNELSTRKTELFNEFYKLVLFRSPSGKDRQVNSRTMNSLINARIQDSLFISFLSSVLQWAPDKRLTPDDALRHPWLLDKFESNHDITTKMSADPTTTVDEISSKRVDPLRRMNDFLYVFSFENETSEESEEQKGIDNTDVKDEI
jgi:hypothetical protein